MLGASDANKNAKPEFKPITYMKKAEEVIEKVTEPNPIKPSFDVEEIINSALNKGVITQAKSCFYFQEKFIALGKRKLVLALQDDVFRNKIVELLK